MKNEPDVRDDPPRPAAPGGPIDLAPAIMAALRAITSATDRGSLASGIAESLSILDVDSYLLARYKGPAGSMEIVAFWDRHGRSPPPRTRISEAQVADLKKLGPGRFRVHDDWHSSPSIDEATRRATASPGIGASATFPLMDRGEMIGIFSALRDRPHAHTREEIQLLELVAQVAALALVGIEHRERLTGQVQLARALYGVSETLSRVSDEAALHQATVDVLVRDIGYSGGWIGTVDAERRVLASRATADRSGVENPLIPYDLDDRRVAAVRAFHEGRPMIITDLLEQARADGWGEVAAAARMESAVYVPLKAGGEMIGVLGVSSAEPTLAEDEVALIAAFGTHLAGAIARARMDREREGQVEHLQNAYETQARLLEVVRELSTPVIPLYRGILVLPLVGTIDSSRSAQIMDALLAAVVRDQASVVILDVTGVAVVDSGVADHLLRSIRATSLLGASCVLVGISPVVAQTMVALGVDLSEVVTRGDLEAGVAHALRLLGLGIRPIRPRAVAPR